MAEPSTLTLYLPGLLGPLPMGHRVPDGLPPIPLITRLLSRADSHSNPNDDWHRRLLQSFSISAEPDVDPPLAAISRYAEDEESKSDPWVFADPVLLLPDRDKLYLASEAISLSSDEQHTLLTLLNATYADSGWRWFAREEGGWYLNYSGLPPVKTTPTSMAFGGEIGPLLPKGERSIKWHALLNELQMVLFEHPVNIEREQRGMPPVTGLWLWGSGSLPLNARSPYDAVYSTEQLVKGLAALGGGSVSPLSSLPSLGQDGDINNALVVDSSLLSPLRRLDWAQWIERAQQMEQMLFATIEQLLRQGRVQRVIIDSGNGIHRLRRSSLRRWWRRKRSIGQLFT